MDISNVTLNNAVDIYFSDSRLSAGRIAAASG
jgi:hypothetical protein